MEQLLNVIFIKTSASFPYLALLSSMENINGMEISTMEWKLSHAHTTRMFGNVNHLDIAPRYASILMGISNGVGTFAGNCLETLLIRNGWDD